MDPVFQNLLVLMVVVWTCAVLLRRLGLPTVMGELVMGVLVGPAVFGWVEPSEVISVLAQMGIFFLMLHTGVETHPREFFSALRISMGVAVVGALVPFTAAVGVALLFGLPMLSAVFVGLTMTATAVVVTLKVLRDVGLDETPVARVIMAACVLDDLLTLVVFSLALGVIEHGAVEVLPLLWTVVRAGLFFGGAVVIGHFLYPYLSHPFRDREGKGFTFLLVLGLAFGLVAEAIGLHMILGAYLAGLFLREEVASRELMQKVEDRLNGIAYSFLGPIFFVSLGFQLDFDAFTGRGLAFALLLTATVAVGQVLSAGLMARRLGFDWIDASIVGIGMCGRAEMAFVLASLGLAMGAFDATVFSVLVLTAFLLNLLTPLGLKLCSTRRARSQAA